MILNCKRKETSSFLNVIEIPVNLFQENHFVFSACCHYDYIEKSMLCSPVQPFIKQSLKNHSVPNGKWSERLLWKDAMSISRATRDYLWSGASRIITNRGSKARGLSLNDYHKIHVEASFEDRLRLWCLHVTRQWVQYHHIRVTSQRNRQQRAAIIQGPCRHISTKIVRHRLSTSEIRQSLCWTYSSIATSLPSSGSITLAFVMSTMATSVVFWRIKIQQVLSKLLIWRQCNEHYTDCCVVEAGRCGGGSLMVCVGFIYHHRTCLYVFL